MFVFLLPHLLFVSVLIFCCYIYLLQANEQLDKIVADPRVNDATASQLEDCHTQLLSHLPLVEAFCKYNSCLARCFNSGKAKSKI